jgi:hypothetical protein
MGWGPPPHPMDLMKYCHIIIYWKWGGRQICTFVGGRGGGGGCGWANHCYSNFAWRVFPVYVPITLFHQIHGVGKGCGGEADLFIFVICTCVGGRGGGLDVGDQNSFLSYLLWRIFSVNVYCILNYFIKFMGWGGGGGRSVYSRHTHLYIWGLAGGGGGWGGMGWRILPLYDYITMFH